MTQQEIEVRMTKHLKAKDGYHLTVAACGVRVLPDERDQSLTADRDRLTCKDCIRAVESGKWKPSKRGDWWERAES